MGVTLEVFQSFGSFDCSRDLLKMEVIAGIHSFQQNPRTLGLCQRAIFDLENELHKSAEFKITPRAGTAVKSQVLLWPWRLLTISCWPLLLLVRCIARWRASHALFWNAPLRRPKISHHSWIKQGTWYGKYSSDYYVLLQKISARG